MISATAAYLAEEAKRRGRKEVKAFTFFPYEHPTGVGSGGTFLNTVFILPDRIQANYGGFATGYWISPVMAANLGRYPVTAQVNLNYQTPGYDLNLYFRSARTQAGLAAAAWSAFSPGGSVDIYPYYQWKMEFAGYRCWALAAGETPDAFTMYAVPAAGDAYDSYAASTPGHSHDPVAYVEAALFLGEFPIPASDIISPGTISIAIPEEFGGLAAGEHLLTLNNRHGRYNPGRSDFIFAHQNSWKRTKVRGEFGYLPPGAAEPELLTQYVGEVRGWGPADSGREADGAAVPQNIQISSVDLLAALLEKPIGAPGENGERRILTYGDYPAQAEKLADKALFPPLKTANFEKGNLEELTAYGASSGGSFGIIGPGNDPLEGDFSLEFAITGSSQQAWGTLQFPSSQSEMFATCRWRWGLIPSAITANTTFLKIRNSAGVDQLAVYVGTDGRIYAGGEDTGEVVTGSEGILQRISLWISAAKDKAKVWIGDGNEAYTKDLTLSDSQFDFWFGLSGSGDWQAAVDSIEIGNKYHDQCYQVAGGPFSEIKAVYVGNVPRTANLEKLPEYGAVNFTDAANEVSEEVTMMVAGRAIPHAADMIADLIAVAGLGSSLNAASVSAVKTACPDDLGAGRFGDDEQMTFAEGIGKICEVCLYHIYSARGEIHLLAYTGVKPAAPGDLTLTRRNVKKWSFTRNEERIYNRVVATWGNYKRNPGLSYETKNAEGILRDGDMPKELKFCWGEAFVTGSETLARQKADLALKRFQEGIDTMEVEGFLAAARVEIDDEVRADNPHYFDSPQMFRLMGLDLNLDRPGSGTKMTLMEFPGE